MFEQLAKKIKAILVGNTLISIVYNHEPDEIRGDPAVAIVPSDNESDYNTTEENVRLYAFTIRIYVKRNAPREPEDADRIMRELVDSIINDLDKYYTLSETGTDGSAIPGGAITNPTGYTFINLFAAPSRWGYSGREDEYRSSEIRLQCRVSVNLSTIS